MCIFVCVSVNVCTGVRACQEKAIVTDVLDLCGPWDANSGPHNRIMSTVNHRVNLPGPALWVVLGNVK